jgi:catechol-2,3-dioxygenase
MTDAPTPANERGRIAPAKLAHCVLRTRQFEPMVDWYKTVLEAEAAFENPFICFMTYDDEHHRIAIAANPMLEDRPLNAVGVDHLAFTYAGLDDLLETYCRLKSTGITPSTTIHHGATLSLYYLDPDLNQVELQIDVFDSLQEAMDWLTTSQFKQNPIGVLFDIEDLVKRWKEGEPVSELGKPIEGPLPGPDAFAPH